ncbi:MAG: DUF2497 domain-containing protein [Acetobacteraceae bacterium]
MEDILASIRRILNEDKDAAALPAPGPHSAGRMEAPPRRDDVLVLDGSMMVSEPKLTAPAGPPSPPAPPGKPAEPASTFKPDKPESERMPPAPTDKGDGATAPDAGPERLVAPAAAAAAAASLGNLVRTLAGERGTLVHRSSQSGGPTIEEMVREELRPFLKAWLDAHLPGLVERVVRAEIERILGNSVP